MPRRIQVLVSCDICLEETETEDPQRLALNGQEVETDLCETHRAELSAFLEPYLAAGHKPGKPAPVAPSGGKTKQPCPTCDKGFSSRETLKHHVETQHNTTLNELLAAQGATLELLNCPECSESFVRKQGLAAHRRQKHGVVGATAKQQGTTPRRRKQAASA